MVTILFNCRDDASGWLIIGTTELILHLEIYTHHGMSRVLRSQS